MKKAVRKTGDYGIGIMIHSVHMTDDVPALAPYFFTTDAVPAVTE